MRWYEQLDEKLRDYLPDLTAGEAHLFPHRRSC